MLTIPLQPPEADAGQPPASESAVLVIGRSENVLRETVSLLCRSGRTAGATNDFANVLGRFDARALDAVVFGGMVPPEMKEKLRAELSEANPAIDFIQGLAGIPGVISAQVEAATAQADPATVGYDPSTRTIELLLGSSQQVSAVAFWATALVPPEPQSTSEAFFLGTLGAGSHTVPLPDSLPDVASFVVVRVGSAVHPFTVGAMPPMGILAPPT